MDPKQPEPQLSGLRPAVYVHSVSFKLDDQRAALAADLRDTFPNGTWAEMARWLFSDSEVVARIHERIKGAR